MGIESAVGQPGTAHDIGHAEPVRPLGAQFARCGAKNLLPRLGLVFRSVAHRRSFYMMIII